MFGALVAGQTMVKIGEGAVFGAVEYLPAK